jgi:hypothetical protein
MKSLRNSLLLLLMLPFMICIAVAFTIFVTLSGVVLSVFFPMLQKETNGTV